MGCYISRIVIRKHVNRFLIYIFYFWVCYICVTGTSYKKLDPRVRYVFTGYPTSQYTLLQLQKESMSLWMLLDFHDPTKKILSHQQEKPKSSDQAYFVIPVSSVRTKKCCYYSWRRFGQDYLLEGILTWWGKNELVFPYVSLVNSEDISL